MARNGSGTYTPPGASFPAVANTLIESAKYNAVVNDIATALTGSLAANGETTVTADLPMATYKHTGVGNASALTQYATADQVVDNALTHGGTSAAGTDTYAVSLTISPGAYAAKQRFQFIADVDNTGACTINFNSLGAKSIKLATGADPHNGAIQANSVVDIVYDGTNFILLNPSYADVFQSTSITGTTVNASTTFQIGGVAVTSTAAELNKVDGFTGVVGDLNIVSGGAAAGVTATEFQYLNGVTSAIQTQINAKQAADAQLDDIAALTPTANNFVTGDGANLVMKTPAQALDAIGVDGSSGVIAQGDLASGILDGDYVTITSGSASGNSTQVTAIASGYRELLFEITGYYSNDNGHYWNFRFGDGSYAGTYYYTDIISLSAQVEPVAQTTMDTYIGSSVVTTSNDSSGTTLKGKLRIINNTDSSMKRFESEMYIGTSWSAATYKWYVTGLVNVPGEIDQVAIYCGTNGAATILGGTYTLKGLYR